MGAWIKEKVGSFFGGIVDGIKGMLGIQSPSKVFAGIGGNMALGLGAGFEREMNGVAKRINKSVPTSIDMKGQYQVEGIVNGLSGVIGRQPMQNQTIQIVLDSKVIAQTIFDPLRNVTRQRGVAFG